MGTTSICPGICKACPAVLAESADLPQGSAGELGRDPWLLRPVMLAVNIESGPRSRNRRSRRELRTPELGSGSELVPNAIPRRVSVIAPDPSRPGDLTSTLRGAPSVQSSPMQDLR